MLLLLRSSQAPSEVTGSATLTLGLGLSATGTVGVDAAVSIALGAFSLASAGTVSAAEAQLVADLAIAPLTIAASGTVDIIGNASLTVGMDLSAHGYVGTPQTAAAPSMPDRRRGRRR